MLSQVQKEVAKHLISFAEEWYFFSDIKTCLLLNRYKNFCYRDRITDELIKYVNKILGKSCR